MAHQHIHVLTCYYMARDELRNPTVTQIRYQYLEAIFSTKNFDNVYAL